VSSRTQPHPQGTSRTKSSSGIGLDDKVFGLGLKCHDLGLKHKVSDNTTGIYRKLLKIYFRG